MSYFKDLNPYQVHQKLINDYILKRPGDTNKLYMRDTSKDQTDLDVIRNNHQFLWNDDDVDSWEKQLAKRYYDKLFKEYCIADLTRYKENKVSKCIERVVESLGVRHDNCETILVDCIAMAYRSRSGHRQRAVHLWQ